MLAVGRLDAGHPAVRAENPRHAGSERDPSTPASMRLGEEPGGGCRHDAAHRVLRHLDDVHRRTSSDRNRGKLEADEAGADDHHLARLVQSIAQDIRVGEGAQRQHAVELRLPAR